MLEMTHNHGLIFASLLVAMMAGFTGLSLMQGASNLAILERKRILVMAAISMGTGIWSMHFIAMLGMKLSAPFFYDALITLASALVAILVVGIALIILHFIPRTTKTKLAAGMIVGLGILVMHYLGMYGIRLVQPQYSIIGIFVAIVTSTILSVSMVFISYSERRNKNIIAGTVLFGIAVFTVHFVAMMGTSFNSLEDLSVPNTWLSNEFLAMGVAISSFVISGSFLLMSVSLLPANVTKEVGTIEKKTNEDVPHTQGQHEQKAIKTNQLATPKPFKIPYEKNNSTYFIDAKDVAAVRAEGHYTILYSVNEKHFCPWSISQTTKRLSDQGFLQTHRSYLVNPVHISSFERTKDNGFLLFAAFSSFEKVPVSRSKLVEVREKLAL